MSLLSESDRKIKILPLIILCFAIIILYIIQGRNYLLFHALTEIFSIVIAFSIFILVWNSSKYLSTRYMIILGISYLFIALLDLLHTLGYRGMNIFTDYDYYANQLWIAARMMEALTLSVSLSFVGRVIKIKPSMVFSIYTVLTAIVIYTIFFSSIFPVCFIEGHGQTSFKICSEYVIIVILLYSLFTAFRNRRRFIAGIYRMLNLSIIFTVVSELAFTFYVSNYGFSNMVGHFAKIISFYFLYRAVIQKSISEPYQTIFNELNTRKDELERVDELKSGLFSVISHDLSGMFGGITGVVQGLDEDYDQISESERKEYVGELRIAVDTGAILVSNLLEWSRLEMGGAEIKKENCSLKQMLDEAGELLAPYLYAKNLDLKISVEPDVELLIERESFMIIARNILSNAVKFSYQGGSIEVDARQHEDSVFITFRDHGTGMDFDPLKSNRIVHKSIRGTGNEKGAGLGLTLIKRYTEKLGGTLSIKTAPGEGTGISLELPVN